MIHYNPESHSSPIRQSSYPQPNLRVSPIINIDVDTQILPVRGTDNSCCGWTESGPMSAPDTLQLCVTDAQRVHTHINTLQCGMKSPFLTRCFFFFSLNASPFCSPGVCDQMWPLYKFNKDESGPTVCVCLHVSESERVHMFVCACLFVHVRMSEGEHRGIDTVCEHVSRCVCVDMYESMCRARVRACVGRRCACPDPIDGVLLNALLAGSMCQWLIPCCLKGPSLLLLSSSPCRPVTPSSQPPQMGPFFPLAY